ncbi:MAG: SGNH hydrolase domain-containing protein [Bdellovibrionota bacterium]
MAVFAFSGSYLKPGFEFRLSKEVISYTNGAKDKNPDRKKCHTMSIKKIQNGELCKIGKEKKYPDFIVWGDSYADALMPGIKDQAAKRGLYGLTASSSGCGPLLDVNRFKKWNLKCDHYGAAMADAIQKNNIKNAILISAWGIDGYSLVKERELTRYDFITSPKYSPQDINIYIEGLKKMLHFLQSHGVKVWIVDKIPFPDFNVPSYLGRYTRLGKNIEALRVDINQFNDNKKVVTDILKELKKNYSFEIISPSDILCNASGCNVQNDGLPLYYDHHHISGSGSKYLMQIFDTMFFEIEKSAYLRRKNKRFSITLQENGIPVSHYGNYKGLEIGDQHSIVAIAEAGLYYWNTFLAQNNPKVLLSYDWSKKYPSNRNMLPKDKLSAQKMLKACANHLMENVKKSETFSVWTYSYDFSYNTKKGWRSSQAQISAIQLLLRAYEITHDKNYLETANHALNAFFVTKEAGGLAENIGKEGLWFDKFISIDNDQPKILNGMMFVLIGLNDAYRYTNNPKLKKLFMKGLYGLTTQLHKYDTGTWSSYDIHGRAASQHYHNIHIQQLQLLYKISSSPILLEYKNRFIQYKNVPIKSNT